ncbi:MAG: S-formylglutathione hydrolase [Piscirickettsiaceae bacterium]|nr:MAG: S-formylglutathione hydrolase [Piscirickettsiaceae bacterium]
MPTLELISQNQSFGGTVLFYKHFSSACQTDMRFSVFLPPQVASTPDKKLPVLFWLSGLTCTEENFMAKAGAQQYAAELGIILIAPDTSPRDLNLPGEDDSWDFGSGAGFYINAINPPWHTNYRMEDYVVNELFELVGEQFPANLDKAGIFGHSMGGHGAITLAFKYPNKYQSLSAFSPICAPTLCLWGKKAFMGYLGQDTDSWAKHDAHLLIRTTTTQLPLLIDQGSDDPFLQGQLLPEHLVNAAKDANYPVTYRLQEGYDHSYYFIASFMEEHIRHHAKQLIA